MPLDFGQASLHAVGRCRKHNAPLTRRPREELSERIAVERAAAEAKAYLGDDARRAPIPSQPKTRKGDCAQCIEEAAAAALAYLNGDDETETWL